MGFHNVVHFEGGKDVLSQLECFIHIKLLSFLCVVHLYVKVFNKRQNKSWKRLTNQVKKYSFITDSINLYFVLSVTYNGYFTNLLKNVHISTSYFIMFSLLNDVLKIVTVHKVSSSAFPECSHSCRISYLSTFLMTRKLKNLFWSQFKTRGLFSFVLAKKLTHYFDERGKK